MYQVLHYDAHFQGKIWWNSTRHEKQLKRKTIKTTKRFKLSTVSMERASIPTPAISVKSHLIEWVGSSWSNPSVKCVLAEIKSDMRNLICGCTIIGLCLSIWLTVNYDMLVAWVPRCNEVWMCEAGTSLAVLCTPTPLWSGMHTNASILVLLSMWWLVDITFPYPKRNQAN